MCEENKSADQDSSFILHSQTNIYSVFFKLGSKVTQLRLYGWEIWKAEKNTKTFPKDGRLDRRDT